MFTRGGVNGLTRVTREYPALARCLALALKMSCPEFLVTSLCITCNTTSHPHRDVFNLQGTSNAIIPIVLPNKGGELWIAGPAQEPDRQRAIKTCNEQPKVGYLYSLQEPVLFDPREWHATHRWAGDRMMLVGYSLQGISRLSSRDIQQLKSLGFPLPPGPSSCSTLRLKRFLSKDLTCCQLLPSDSPSDAYLNEQQGRHAEDSSGTGRDTAQRLDQGPAQVKDRRAEGGSAEGHDRERCVQGDQQVSDEGSSPGSLGAASDRVLQERQLGPDEGALDEALHDQPGAAVQNGLPGLWQVRQSSIRRSGGTGHVLCELDNPHDGGQSRLPLEVETVRGLGQEPFGDGKGDLDPALQQPRAQLRELCAPQPPDDTAKRGQLKYGAGVPEAELIPDETMSQKTSSSQDARINELESELKALKEMIKVSHMEKSTETEATRKQPRQQEQ